MNGADGLGERRNTWAMSSLYPTVCTVPLDVGALSSCDRHSGKRSLQYLSNRHLMSIEPLGWVS